MPFPRKPSAVLGYECGPQHVPTPPPPKAPRAKRPSELKAPAPALPPDQADVLAALGPGRYATVGGGCRVLEVVGAKPLDLDALAMLEAAGKVERVVLVVFKRVEDV